MKLLVSGGRPACRWTEITRIVAESMPSDRPTLSTFRRCYASRLSGCVRVAEECTLHKKVGRVETLNSGSLSSPVSFRKLQSFFLIHPRFFSIQIVAFVKIEAGRQSLHPLFSAEL